MRLATFTLTAAFFLIHPMTATLFATEVASAAVPSDAGVAISRLAELGVPELKGGVWVDPVGLDHLFSGSWGYTGEAEGVVRTGVNGHRWLACGEWSEAPRQMEPGVAGIKTLFPAYPGIVGDPQEREMARKAIWEKVKAIPSANLSEDVNRLIIELGKTASKIERRGGRRTYNLGDYKGELASINGSAGAALVFAAQISRMGDPSLAEKLAAEIFEKFPDHAGVWNAALSLCASFEYREATDSLEKSGDWKAYEKSLTEIVGKFSPDWIRIPEIKSLLTLVRKRAAMPAATPPEPASSTERAFAALLSPDSTPTPRFDGRFPSSLWLLPTPPWDQNNPRSGYGWTDDELSRARARALISEGSSGVPVLVSALDDDALSPFLTRAALPSRHLPPDLPAEMGRMIVFDGLRRPLTRGEIVRTILIKILPLEEDRRSPISNEALREGLAVFLKEHGHDTPVDLALFYARQGNRWQKLEAFSYLAASDYPGMKPAFESAILEDENIDGHLREVTKYLEKKGGESREFGLKFLAKLKAKGEAGRKPGKGMDYSENGSRLQLEAYRAAITSLTDLLSPDLLRERLLRLAAIPAVSGSGPHLFEESRVVESLPEKERVALLADMAGVAKGEREWDWCTSRLSSRINPAGHAYSKDGPVYVPPVKGDAGATVWSALIADTTPVLNADIGSFTGTRGEAHAMLYESFFEDIPAVIRYFAKGAGIADVYVRRAKSRLEGGELPSYPDPSVIDADRLSAFVAEVASTPDDRIEAWFKKVPVSEKLAWMAWIRMNRQPGWERFLEMKGSPVAMPAALADRERRFSGLATSDIRFDPVTAFDSAAAAELMALPELKPGAVVDAGWFSRLGSALARESKKYSGCCLIFSNRDPLFPGIRLYVSRMKIKRLPRDPGPLSVPNGISRGMMQELDRKLFEYHPARRTADAFVLLGRPHENIAWSVKAGVVGPSASVAVFESNPLGGLFEIRMGVLTADDAAILSEH